MAASAVAPVAVAAGPAQAAVTTRAVWHMQDPSALVDSSGLGNDGTTRGITSVAGFAGRGYHFEEDAVADVPDSPSLDPGTATLRITVHVRFSVVPSTTVGDYDLIRKGLAGTVGGDWKMEIFPASRGPRLGTAYCQFQDANHVTASVRDDHDLADGRWHTVVCLKTRRQVKVVVDGVTRSVSARLGAIDNSKPLTFGAKPDGADQYLGDMDEVRIQIG